jgi:2,4-dienoyl-CoA reductase-like NADH-dependent reductase (Old Yellow Enzyme family)
MNRKKGLKLFTPVQLGSLKLKHRVVMAPLTRSRSEQPGASPVLEDSPTFMTAIARSDFAFY